MSAPISPGYYQRSIGVHNGFGLYLFHLRPDAAAECRRDNPGAFIVGRFDPGDDSKQAEFGSPPAIAAERFYSTRIVPFATPGVFSAILGINEAWPDMTGLWWRADFELALCRLVQGKLGLPYIWGGISVGCLDANEVAIFAPVWREAWAVNYHAYLAPGRKSIAEEADQWNAWRPFAIWLPELRRLGIPLRLFVGECGPYSPDLRGDELARCQVGIHRAIRERAACEGIEYAGACGYGAGLMDNQKDWELESSVGIFETANREDGASAPAHPVLASTSQEQPKVTTTPRLWLALIPSCQGQNPVIGGGSEADQMANFARELAAAAARYPAIACRVITSPPERDYTNLPGLRAQIATAVSWLDTAPAGCPTVALHLHSDSGPTHVGAYYGDQDITKRLAAVLLDVLGRAFYTTAKFSMNYQTAGYLAWTLSPNKHCPVLLECGSHEVVDDVRRLRDGAAKIADELVRTMLTFFALPLTQTAAPVVTPAPAAVDTVTDALNGVWHFATLAESATDLTSARTNATLMKGKVVALKAALGR